MLPARLLSVFVVLSLCQISTSQTPNSVAASTGLEITDTIQPAPYVAQMRKLSDARLSVSNGGETRDIELGDLRRVRFLDTEPVVQGPYAVTLRDGSVLTAKALTSDGPQALITLASGQELTLETKQLNDIRWRELTGPQQTQWQAMRDSRVAADLLVLVRSEESLDKIEGLVQRITPQAIEFEFGGQTIPAPIAKLAGLRFFTSTKGTVAKLAAVVRDTSGNQWNAAQLSSAPGGDALEIVLQGGLSFAIPYAQLAEIDFSVGSMKYLADLQPLERVSDSRFDLAIANETNNLLFGARVARRAEIKAGPSIEFLGSGSATYRVPADFKRMVGTVELDPPGNSVTPCLVQVLLEKKVVWEQRLAETKQPHTLDIPVVGDQRVQLVVKPQSSIPVGDVVLFRGVRFLK